MTSKSDFFYFVLNEPENPENIGAAARAIKNMGFKNLRLVRPPARWQERGKKMAPHALDIFEGAQVFASLAEALKDIHVAYGTSRRAGPQRGTFLAFPEALRKMRRAHASSRLALVFGKESKGLDNEALRLCDWVTTIPTHADCPSINLAQAVMVCGFALSGLGPLPPAYKHRGTLATLTLEQPVFVSKSQLSGVLNQIEEALMVLGYEHGSGSRTVERIRATWHRLFKRSGLLESEAQMLRGLTRRIKEKSAAGASVRNYGHLKQKKACTTLRMIS